MKINRHYTLLLSTILFLSLLSCGENTSHETEVSYFAIIAVNLKNITHKVLSYTKELKQATITATQNQDHKLDKLTLDTLKSKFESIIAEYDESITKVTSLKEIDKQLDFKNRVSAFLKDSKETEVSIFSKGLKMLEIGLDKITDQDKEILNRLILNLQDNQTKSNKLEDLALDFQKKHNITNKELEKYGL